MGDVVNLNRFRKIRKRAGDAKAADENRAKFGRTKAEKTRDEKTAETLERQLDGHKRDDEE